MYVTHTYFGSLTIVDEESRAVRQVKGLEADLVAVNEKAGRVYLLGYEGGELRVLDVDGKVLTEVSAGMHGWGMAVDEATGAVFVARVQDAEVAQFDAEGKLVRRIGGRADSECGGGECQDGAGICGELWGGFGLDYR